MQRADFVLTRVINHTVFANRHCLLALSPLYGTLQQQHCMLCETSLFLYIFVAFAFSTVVFCSSRHCQLVLPITSTWSSTDSSTSRTIILLIIREQQIYIFYQSFPSLIIHHIVAEMCALVNKTSGASASASERKYQRRYHERQRFQILAALFMRYFYHSIYFCNKFNYIYEDTTHDTKAYGRQHTKKDK